MSIEKIGVGALIGAGIAATAAAVLGDDGGISQELLQQGGEGIIKGLSDGTLKPGDVGYYLPPTAFEQLYSAAGDVLGEAKNDVANFLSISPDHVLTIQTVSGPVEITDISKFQQLANSLLPTDPVRPYVENLIQEFQKGVAEKTAGAVTQEAVAAASATHYQQFETLVGNLDNYLDGISQVNPADIEGLKHLPLANGGDLYLKPDGVLDKLDVLKDKFKVPEKALEALKDHLSTPLSVGTSAAFGAGAGGLAGSLLPEAGAETMNHEVMPQRRFQDRMPPREQAVVMPRKPNESWTQMVQNPSPETNPQVVR